MARTRYTPLRGGRTNRLWRFECDGAAHVCKLYAPNAATPLFPNDPQAEARALAVVGPAGLGPVFCFRFDCASGQALVYRYLDGNTCVADPAAVARSLARLHDVPPPTGLDTQPTGAKAILAQGEAMLCGLTGAKVRALAALRPEPARCGKTESCFLHGDVVPANVIDTQDGPRFIDWQCPATGDPVEDLAIYLSPAMQHLYGGAPLTAVAIRQVLDDYGHPDRAKRYQALAPAFHWRMAAYCLWKESRGDDDYVPGFDLEISCLKDLA